MYPVLFNYKLITIGTYGLLLGTAFYLAFLLTEREFRINGKDPDLAYKLLIAIIPSAIVGAKIFHILDNLQEFSRNPSAMIFSGAGLSVYGGFLLSFLVAAIIIKTNGEKILTIFDLVSPSMALGYGIGRLGCHASGDGCYGEATKSFIGLAYPNGLEPISVNVYPTPLIESFLSLVFFFILMKLRKKEMTTGTIFFLFLIMNGSARIAIELIRRNPPVLLGITQAQIIGILFALIGAAGIIYNLRKQKIETA